MYLAPYTELVSVSFAIAAIFMMPNTAICGCAMSVNCSFTWAYDTLLPDCCFYQESILSVVKTGVNLVE